MLSVRDPEFAEYGRFLGESPEIAQYLNDHTPMPEGDRVNIYIREDAAFGALPAWERFKEEAFGFAPTEAGYCNGYNSKLNCLEAHSCPEVNVAGEDLVLLLALNKDIENGKIHSSKTKAFLLKKGEAIMLYPYTWHFSPCKQKKEGFRCAVLLSLGTNEPLEKPQGALWAKNKWLFAHPESNQAKQGAYLGIEGENIEVPW